MDIDWIATDITARMQRQALACALLANPAFRPDDARSLLSETAAWVATGQWPADGKRARMSPINNTPIRSTKMERPIQRGSLAERALAYFQELLDNSQPIPGNPDIARALGLTDPGSDNAGRLVSKLLGRVARHQGWKIERTGCAAADTYRRRIIAPDGRSTPTGILLPRTTSQPSGLGAASTLGVAIAALFDGTQSQAPAMEPDAIPSAATAAPETMPAILTPAGELEGTPIAARNPEAQHVTVQTDTGHVPEAAGAPLGVAPAQGGGWPGGVKRDGKRHVDHCATMAVEIVEAGQVLPTLAESLAWLKNRYNGAWIATGDIAAVSACFTQLKNIGFCTVSVRREYPMHQGQPRVRQVTLWDGRTSALPAPPEPKPPARPITENMAASNARRAEQAAIVDPAGTRRKDKLAAILLRCVEEQTPVPGNVEIGQALNMHPCNTPDVLKDLREDGWGRMDYIGKGGNMRRRFILADGRATPWTQGPSRMEKEAPTPKAAAPKAAPVVTAKPAPVPAPPKAITRAEPPTVANGAISARPNINTGIYERRPSPAAKAPLSRDVSPELRAEIERRVAAGQITRADKPGYAAPTDSTAAGVPVYSSAGGGRRPSY